MAGIDKGGGRTREPGAAEVPAADTASEQIRRRVVMTKGERLRNAESYEWTAWASTCGITSVAITATYLRLLREVRTPNKN